MPDGTPIRTAEVRPPSGSGETLAVLRAASAVVFVAWFGIGLRSGGGGAPGPGAAGAGAAAAGAGLLPFQALFSDLPAADQRLFRQLQEGFAEAELDRGAMGTWPSSEGLAARGVPPFAPEPVDRGAYAWSFRTRSNVVNYLGSPAAGSGRKPFLLLVEEPDPQAPPDASHRTAVLDEEHRLLPCGTIVHVTVWLAPEGTAAPGDLLFRQALALKGWKQIRIGPAYGR